MNDPDAPNVVEDLSRLRPHRTVEAESEEEFRNAVRALDPDEVRVVILGKPRRWDGWEPLGEVYWSGPPEYDSRGRLDVPMPTKDELRSYARRHGVRFAKGAVQTPVMADSDFRG